MTAPTPAALVSLIVALMAGSAWGGRLLLDDEPGAASNNGQFYANPDRKRTSTQVFRWLGQKKDPMIWEKAGWSDATFLSDDGEYLVAGDYCERTLPRRYTLDQVIATFYHRATPVRSVRLRDLIVDPKKVKQGLWGQCMGFIKGPGNRFAIDTWEYRHLVFDGTTGALVEVLPGGPIPNIR
jgi:hypothetical protein